MIQASAFEFFKLLKQNNNREWFAQNKDTYLKELARAESFANELLLELNKHDVIETPSGKKSLHRIYRDVRFSKEKIPYNTHWGGSFKRATKYRRGGYYFHVEPGNTFVAGGFFNPNPADLKLIRDEIAFDPAPLRKILSSQSFIDTFQTLKGEQLKTAPKGFDADDEAIDLLRYKQFLLIHKFTDKEALSKSFVKAASDVFKNMRPFFDYMSDALASDVNGVSL